MKNLFRNNKAPKTGERIVTLFKSKNVRVEKIVSSNKLKKKIYMQNHDEWVLLLHGRAQLRVKKKMLSLSPGDSLLITSGQEHEVVKTKQDKTPFG